MASVDALPLRVTVSRTPREPFVRTMFGLRHEAVVDRGDVLHVDGRAVDRLDRQVVEVVDAAAGCCSAEPDTRFRANFAVPAGRIRF